MIRGPAPLSLALAHLAVDDTDTVVFSTWCGPWRLSGSAEAAGCHLRQSRLPPSRLSEGWWHGLQSVRAFRLDSDSPALALPRSAYRCDAGLRLTSARAFLPGSCPPDSSAVAGLSAGIKPKSDSFAPGGSERLVSDRVRRRVGRVDNL